MDSQLSADSESNTVGVRRSLIRPRYFVLALLMAALAVFIFISVAPARSSTIPTFGITSVVTDTTVTIQTQNMPANQNFVVTMGPFGSKGVDGIVVATTNSGAGGSFSATYDVPAEMKGASQVAVRMETSHDNPYFAYNWFWNNTTGGTTGGTTGTGGVPGYTGIPTFNVTAVDPGNTATIQTSNFPPNQAFTVTMGPFGSKGVNGIVVGTLNSGAGGALTATFNIPAELQTAYQVAIRTETSQAAPFFAYNWFYNNTTGTGGQPPPPTPPPAPPVSTGIPTFTVCSVVQNQTVTIRTKDFPPNLSFQVTMGPFGTQGIGGPVVGTLNSGVGGQLTATFTIPAELAGSSRIAIRTQADPFFAYNWFYNTTATVC